MTSPDQHECRFCKISQHRVLGKHIDWSESDSEHHPKKGYIKKEKQKQGNAFDGRNAFSGRKTGLAGDN